MLEIKNTIVPFIVDPRGKMARFVKMKGILDQKCAAYLRLLATKNNINRASDYHYLNLAVTQSTEPVNGIDYIHPVVKPTVDYATAVVTKGLAQNGEISFEFVADNEDDDTAARQATNMVSKIVNQQNDPHQILQHWVMDAALHKNGEMLISPVREQITRYITTTGTLDQLKAFEAQTADAGLSSLRQSRRKISVDMEMVVKETQQFLAAGTDEERDAEIQSRMNSIDAQANDIFEEDVSTTATAMEVEAGEDMLADAIARNTIYEAKYKLTGWNINIRFRPIAQHYWMCDPTVVTIQDQPFCGFYDPMSIQEAYERYPDIDLEQFMIHAEYSNVGAYQAGSLLNNLALHARDSVPINGLPAQGYAAQEPEARQVTVLTVWNRYDIDGDGELEIVEMIYSGNYVISAKEVEFIPVANMCPKPLTQNFYGMSIAESVVPMQEYMTAGHRAEIQLGLLTATPRLGVKPDRVDFEQLQDGEAAIFILDTKFNPQTDVYPLPPPSGNLQFMEVALNRIQQDTMAMIGMTTPSDTFNPEVMAPGNSGIKLQMALSPNQIIQDNTVKNCAEGLRDALWLVWRTLVQYGDDYGVKKLAQESHPDKKPEFLDALAFDDLNFCERKLIHIDLALGMRSEENQIARLQIIKQCQVKLYEEVAAMVASGTLTPEVFKKIKKPYADTLYVLGVKDCDSYLPSEEEVVKMIEQGAAAMKNKEPSPDDQAKLAKAKLDNARADEIAQDVVGETAEKQLEAVALLKDNKSTNY